MDQAIDEMMIAVFSRGHCLLVGVPGLAKTLMVSSLAQTMSLVFKRIQFTPDLMPSDITGTELLQDAPATQNPIEQEGTYGRSWTGCPSRNSCIASRPTCRPTKACQSAGQGA